MITLFSISNLIILIINLATLGFYYKFYRFHFHRYTETYFLYVALASSIFSAGLALALQASILTLNPYPSHFFKAFLLSGFIEEFAKLIGIYLFFRKNRDDFSVTDGIFYGLILGGGFGLIENILYFINSGLWSQALRSITALPIHMMNGGLLGAFLMIFLFSGSNLIRWIRLLFGLSLCVSVHAFYNYSLLTDSYILIVLPASILSLYFVLEITIAKSRILLPGYLLEMLEMKAEEHEILSRHNRHERWIESVQKHIPIKQVKFLKIPNLRHQILTTFFLIPSLLSLLILVYDPMIIKKTFLDLDMNDYFALFVIYPAILGFMFFFGGILNPYFLRDRMLSVPLFGAVDLHTENSEENTAIYHIYWNKFYIPVSKLYPKDTKAEFDLWIGNNWYGKRKGKIIWSKKNEEGNCGAMCSLDKIPFRFLLRWNLVRFQQNIKNLFVRTNFI